MKVGEWETRWEDQGTQKRQGNTQEMTEFISMAIIY